MSRRRTITVIASSLAIVAGVGIFFGHPVIQRILRDDMSLSIKLGDHQAIARLYDGSLIEEEDWEQKLIDLCVFLGTDEDGEYSIYLLPPNRASKEAIIGCSDLIFSTESDRKGYVVYRIVDLEVQVSFHEDDTYKTIIEDLKCKGAKKFIRLKKLRPRGV